MSKIELANPLTKRTLLVIGQIQDVFNISKNKSSSLVLKSCKSIQETSEEGLFIKARQILDKQLSIKVSTVARQIVSIDRDRARTWNQGDGFIVSCMWWFRLSVLLLSQQRFSFIIIIIMCVQSMSFVGKDKIIFVCTQDETNGLTLLWAHNLFMMWALDFLPWVILAQRSSSNSLTFVFFSLLSCDSILLSVLSSTQNLSTTPTLPLASHIYSQALVEGL